MERWRGKWALVTGASAGIGQSLAKQLAATGVNLVLTARRVDRLAQLASELTARHAVQVEVCPADLTRPQAPEEIFGFTQQKNLHIHVLINNAGFGAYGEFHKTNRQRLLGMVQVNVASVVHLTHLFVPAMIERGSGYIMIVSSTAAFQPVPYLSTYGGTKGFDMLFAGSIAEELREYGVRVTALCPGSTVTEFHQVAGISSSRRRRQESAEKVVRVGLRALAQGEPLVISGVRNRLAMEVQRALLRRMVARVTGRMFRPSA